MSYPKVLVGIVTYEGKDYCWEKVKNNIKKFSYPNYDVLVVDNTKGKKYYHKLKKSGFNVAHVKRGASSREAQARSLNYVRQYMLDNDYDYFLSIESDLVPPRDIIERLLSHRKDVVGTIYYIGYAWSKTQQPRPCLFRTRSDGQTENLPADEGWGMYGTGVQPIHGCGLGTTLISKRIMERFKFWYYINPEDVAKHSDVLFYMDLHNAKQEVYVDTNVIVPHFNSNWNEVKDI